MDWQNIPKIPVGDTAELVFDWLKSNARWLFDGMSAVMDWLIAGVLWALQAPPLRRGVRR